MCSGCSSLTSPGRSSELESGKSYWFDYDASRRGAILISDDKGIRSCAEPFPDVAMALASKVEANVKYYDLDAKARGEFATSAIKLADKSQMILFIREALFRLCEISINNKMEKQDIVKVYGDIMGVALRLGNEKALQIDIVMAQQQIAIANAKAAEIVSKETILAEKNIQLNKDIDAKNKSIDLLLTQQGGDKEFISLKKELDSLQSDRKTNEEKAETLKAEKKDSDDSKKAAIETLNNAKVEADVAIQANTDAKKEAEQSLKSIEKK
jgi:hypothetical protein